VRELRNRIERAMVLGDPERIEPWDLDLPEHETEDLMDMGCEEAQCLRRLLEEEDWNVSRAAKRRGVPRHWLRYRMQKHGLSRPRSGGRR
jgi:transcriptional regulator of acetoin/glycerol metabolism